MKGMQYRDGKAAGKKDDFIHAMRRAGTRQAPTSSQDAAGGVWGLRGR
jgi:hypothetical protein